MRKLIVVGVTVIALAIPTAAIASPHPSCYGQAAAVFAQTGEFGTHSSSFDTPRLGIRNLARALYDAGAIPDDSMAALGVFVADELGLSIDACL
jgi:hypothetical protein